MTAPIGLGHIAVNTPDLDRFRRFYEGLLGISMAEVARVSGAPFARSAVFPIEDVLFLHVFEVPGYDPQAQGIGVDIGERGRIDHFAFIVHDIAALREIAERLRAAGATDGVIRSFGPVLSVHVTDPDGLQFEVTCPDVAYDADVGVEDEQVEEVGQPGWVERMHAAVLGVERI